MYDFAYVSQLSLFSIEDKTMGVVAFLHIDNIVRRADAQGANNAISSA